MQENRGNPVSADEKSVHEEGLRFLEESIVGRGKRKEHD